MIKIFQKDFPNNFFVNAILAVNAQSAGDIPNNCDMELPKIIGCRQRGGTKRLKTQKIKPKQK